MSIPGRLIDKSFTCQPQHDIFCCYADGLLYELNKANALIAELRNQILDTGPMLPKHGMTMRYTEPEEQ